MEDVVNIEKKSNKEIKIIDEIIPIMNDLSKIKEHWNYGLIMDLIFPKLNKLIEKFDGENQIIVISNAMSNAKFAILNIDELFDGYSKQYHNFSRNYRSSVRILAKCAEIL
jgi:hypothetical protein